MINSERYKKLTEKTDKVHYHLNNGVWNAYMPPDGSLLPVKWPDLGFPAPPMPEWALHP